jgi:hypothetical protein
MRAFGRANKSLLAVAVTAGALLSPVVTTTASALPPCCGVDIVTVYYSSADKTTEVGETCDCTDCEGVYSSWGQITPYYTRDRYYCDTSPTR